MTDYTKINYEPVLRAYHEETIVKALVGEVSGKGHQVFVFGCPAYLPTTQEMPSENGANPNDEVDVCVIKLKPENNSVIVSARVAHERKADSEAAPLEVGQIVDAVIKSIAPYGAFATLGHLDGLIHITELSYNQVRNPSEVVSPGQAVKVKILSITEKDGKRKIELSLKQAQPSPWDNLSIKVGDVVEGVVSAVSDYGAFVTVDGVTGMLHSSEVTWDSGRINVHDYIDVGETLTLKVLDIDPAKKRVSLSLRELTDNVWDSVSLNVEDVVEATVIKTADNGADIIVKLDNGLRGILPRKEMAWTKEDARDFFESTAVGDVLKVVVADFDKERRKLMVSRKPLLDNPFTVFMQQHPVGSTVEGEVIKNDNPGVIKISLPIGQFRIAIPASNLLWDDIMEEHPIGSQLSVRIAEYDPETKRIFFEVDESKL